jgi:hypothetical protein
MFPDAAAATITITSIGRQNNSIGLIPPIATSTTEIRVNLRDCLDNIDLTKITFTESSPPKAGDLYLIVGTDCSTNDSLDSDSGDCVVIENAISGMDRSIREVLNIENADGCSSESGTAKIWVARIDDISADRNSSTEDWSAAWTLTYDMSPPDPPVITGTGVGEGKIVLKWATSDNDAGADSQGLSSDVKDVVAVYMNSETDIGNNPNVDGGSGDTDIGGNTDTVPDTAADTSTDTAAAAVAECPSGGFEEGDEYVPDRYEEKFEDTPSSGETTVSGLTDGVAYKVGAVARDEYNNASTISETACAVPNKTRDFADDYTAAGGKVGKFCFVATAAFGSYDHPMVKLLRRFRDQFLAALPGGQTVISGYYRVGPSIAAQVAHHPVLKGAVKGALTLFAIATYPLSALGPLGSLLACLAGLSFFFVRRKLK